MKASKYIPSLLFLLLAPMVAKADRLEELLNSGRDFQVSVDEMRGVLSADKTNFVDTFFYAYKRNADTERVLEMPMLRCIIE
jgi:hypothetical protein